MFRDTSSTCAVPFALHSLMQRRTIFHLSGETLVQGIGVQFPHKIEKKHVYITGLRQQNIFFPRSIGVIANANYLVAIEFNACNAHVDWPPLVASPFLLGLLVSERVRYTTIIVPWQDFGRNCVGGFNTISPEWFPSGHYQVFACLQIQSCHTQNRISQDLMSSNKYKGEDRVFSLHLGPPCVKSCLRFKRIVVQFLLHLKLYCEY